MKHSGIALHGPTGATGIGYGLQQLHKAVNDEYVTCTLSGQRDGWTNNLYHIIVEQPAFIERAPWTGLVPTFELPLREDEKKNLLLPSPHHRMFCLNPFIKEELQKLNPNYPEECFPLIQQGATPKQFPDIEREKGSIGTIGKYEPRKGYDTLFPILGSIGQSYKYAMATSPLHNSEELNSIQKSCDQYGVSLLPWETSYDNVLAFLSSLHVFVTTSHAEGWNLPLTEALAQGCIVVASDIHAHRYQYNKLEEALGKEEASYRLRLVPTHETPIIGHDRWYPGFYYMGKKWLSCDSEVLLSTINKALEDESPEPWSEQKPFPLSWSSAAKRLVELVDIE